MGKHEEVMEMVRRQLERDPPPPTTALYGRAAVLDPEIYKLSLRQFHAKYPLRVKRERAREERARRAAAANGQPAGGDAARERVRSVLYRLARDVAAAEGAADLAAVVGQLPDRVDEVEAILAGAGQGGGQGA